MGPGKLARVSLADVPIEQRIAAADQLALECGTDAEAAELRAAALIPSKRVLYLPATAVADVLPDRGDALSRERRAAA